jgi:hypothetical protein
MIVSGRFSGAPTGAGTRGRVVGAVARPTARRPQFVALDRLFDLEHAGPIVRIWCNACDKSQVLADDAIATVETARESHQCGPRTSVWDKGERV